ncbi:MAG: phospholipid/cholesterol/gamma-HCH transport system substrate-binding protein [Bradyrhizobium sp.]|jgi:phospholipid/cholesterol/gamma-HCH transport system substrate-binding protein|nr:phospholipid/cholesterol/gamma-HCH transport system substrate-binding protein [Bradyrhizobium sp.]
MKSRMTNLMIGSLTLALIAGAFGGMLGYRKFVSTKQRIPLRVIFEGSASGLHKGGSVNFGGIRVGEVVSLKLDNPRRVVALAMIDNTAPLRKDTLAGLEFQGLTGVAALSLIGGSPDAPAVPLDADGVPILTADPEATQDVETRIKAALRNVDQVIADNQADLKDTLLGLETFTASLAVNGEKIDSLVRRAETGVGAVDLGLAKTDALLTGVGAVDFGELLPTVQSIRELAHSFNKKSATAMADSRKMLNEISASVNKVGGPRR